MSWDPSSTVDAYVDGYIIYRRVGAEYKYLYVTRNTVFYDLNAKNHEENYYWVFPYRYLSDGSLKTGPCPQPVSAMPKLSLVPYVEILSDNTSYTNLIRWGKVNGAGYIIYRNVRTDDGDTYTYMYVVGPERTSWRDPNPVKDAYNTYYIYPYVMTSTGTRHMAKPTASMDYYVVTWG